MLTTPLRSENVPPIAAKTSGVVNASVCAISAASKTAFRWSVLEYVARIPRPSPITPVAAAPKPSRRRPRAAVQSPTAAAASPTTIGHVIDRAWIGGMARKAANTPRTIAA